jgi:hypothetical protein
MNWNDKKILRKQILEDWKNMMQPIYMGELRSRYNADEIRQEAFLIIAQHCNEKILEKIRRKKYKSKRILKLKEQLAEQQYDKSMEDLI